MTAALIVMAAFALLPWLLDRALRRWAAGLNDPPRRPGRPPPRPPPRWFGP